MTQSNTTTTVATQPTASAQRVPVDTTPHPHIPFVFAGTLATSTSPEISVWDDFTVLDFSVTLGTVATGPVVVNLLKNGSVLISVTIASGSSFAAVLNPLDPADHKTPAGFKGVTAIQSPNTYTVQAGDTFQSIATAVSVPNGQVTAAEIQAVNPSIQPSQIRAGQVLNLPNGNLTTGTQRGDYYAMQIATAGGADLGGLIGFQYGYTGPPVVGGGGGFGGGGFGGGGQAL